MPVLQQSLFPPSLLFQVCFYCPKASSGFMMSCFCCLLPVWITAFCVHGVTLIFFSPQRMPTGVILIKYSSLNILQK